MSPEQVLSQLGITPLPGGGAGDAAVTNPVPETFARVVPGNSTSPTLNLPSEQEAFVTNASAVRGLDAQGISETLGIPESSSGYKVIEFASKDITNVATPINRTNPGFVGGGRTSGGAPEFVIPNRQIPPGSSLRFVRTGEVPELPELPEIEIPEIIIP